MRRRMTGEMSEIHQRIPNPEEALIAKEKVEKEPRLSVAREVEDEDFTDNSEQVSFGEVSEDLHASAPEDKYDSMMVGKVGSRRTGRYLDTPRTPDRKFKRGDKHRGPEKMNKPSKPQRPDTREDLAA